MFEALIHRATRSVESAVARYALRAAIAVPFIVAFGFALAAATIKLSERYGSAIAFSIVAAVFVAIGVLAMVALAATERGATNLAAETVVTPAEIAQTAGEESPAMPVSDLLLAALGTVGPKAIPAMPAIFRFLVRHWALVVSVALVVFVLMMEKPRSAPAAAPEPAE